MRAVGFRKFGGPEVLEVVDVPQVEPGPGQVRIRVRAAAVNPTDIGMVSGAYGELPGSAPWVPGMDAAGTVEAIGEGVDLHVGQEVMAVVNPRRPERGAQQELLVVPVASVVQIPAGASLAEASTLPMNGLTAILALDMLDLPDGATLAVTGAAGTLGGYVIVLAKERGLRVIADAKAEDEELVRGFGADVVLPRGDGLADRVREAAPGGADGLVDCAVLGEPVFELVRDGGGAAVVRGPQGEPGRGITQHVVMVRERLEDQAGLLHLRTLAQDGRIALRVADTVPPEKAADAYRRMDAGGLRGRLVIEL